MTVCELISLKQYSMISCASSLLPSNNLLKSNDNVFVIEFCFKYAQRHGEVKNIIIEDIILMKPFSAHWADMAFMSIPNAAQPLIFTQAI